MCILLEHQNFSEKVCFLKKIFTFSSFDEKLCRLPPENLPPNLKKCFLHSFSGFSCITLPFPSRKITVTNNFEGKCLEVGKNFFDMVVETALFVFRWDFWRNFFLSREVFKNFSCFQTLRKTFGIFGENNLVGLSKVFSSVQGLFLEESFLKTNFLNCFFLSGLREYFFWTFGENIRQVFQNCILCVQWKFLIGLFFLRKIMSFFTLFRLWGKNCGILAQKLQKLFPNCNLCVKKFFSEIWFWKKKLLHFFRVLIKNFTEFCQKMLSKRKILSKVIFFLGKISCHPTEIEEEGLWCSVETFARLVKTALFVSDWGLWLNCFF